MLGTYEFSDFPLDTETFGVKPGEHIPGTVMHRYLTAYAERFGVFGKIRFDAKVMSTELVEGGAWLVKYDSVNGGKGGSVGAKKLVLATGMTSEANMPSIKGSENFGGKILHTKDMAKAGELFAESEHVVVLGGSKSAYDAVYINASRGKNVEWVIRGIALTSIEVLY